MEILSKSAAETIKVGRIISGSLSKGDIICLFGQVGSGKTVLTKGIALGLGVKEEDVISPSFVLLRQYNKARIPLFHFDFYRLKLTQEIISLGYEEYLYDSGVSVIEWPDRLNYLLPAEFLGVKFSVIGDTKRGINFSAFGRRYKELFRRVYEDIRH